MLGHLIPLWLVAATLVSAGGVGTGLHLFGELVVSPAQQALAGLIGWPCALIGPALGIGGTARTLTAEDRALRLSPDGLGWVEGGAERLTPWARVAGASWSKAGLLIEIVDGEPLRLPARWLGIRGPALAARVLELRRRALLGAWPG